MNEPNGLHRVPSTPLLDGIIELDTERGNLLGFTSDRFDGYLWKSGDAVLVSFIVSKRRGNFRELVRRIHALGLTVKVPTPLGRMQEILLKNGYQHTQEPFDMEPGEMVDVWVLRPSNTQAEGRASRTLPRLVGGTIGDKPCSKISTPPPECIHAP